MKLSKISLGLLIIILLSNNVIAQKLRDKVVRFKHVSIPYNATPLDYTTFSVEAGGEALQISGVSPEGFSRDFKMQGFKRVNGYGGSAGHLHMVVDLGYLTAGKPEFKTHTEKVKDKAGVETVVKSYYYSIPFAGQHSSKVINPTGKILQSSSANYNKVLSTSRVRSAAALRKGVNRYVNDLTVDAAQEIRRDAYSTASSMLTSFDYRKTSSREQVYLIKNHSSEGQWEKHYETIQKNFEAASHYPNLDYLEEELASAIAFYERMAAKKPKGDKKQTRIYKAAILNLATIYYYLDDIQAAANVMSDASDILKKDSRAKRMVRLIEATEKSMEKSGLQTIYYKRELGDAATPGEIASQEDMEAEMMEDKVANKSWVVENGRKVEGTVLVDKGSEDLIFGDGGNVAFITEDNEEIDLTSAAVTAFYIADRSFMKAAFTPSAQGKTESVKGILETVYDSDAIKLYKYYPSVGSLSGAKAEFAFQKKGQQKPISLESTAFLLWKKGLANYFEDCVDLSEMVADGGITKTKDDLIKAARVYSELCKKVIKP